MASESDFGGALRRVRLNRQQSQEDLAVVSGRTYVSSLERNLQSPTLSKVDALARALDLHPLTLLVLAYAKRPTEQAVAKALHTVERELAELLARS